MANDVPPIQSSLRFRIPVISSGKLSIFVTGAFLVVAVLRCNQGDVPKIVEMVVSSYFFFTLGWMLAVVVLVGAVVFIKLIIRFYDREVARIAKERDELQTKLLKK